MAPQALPSPEVLRQLLRYEPDTGNLFWLRREEALFPATMRKATHDAAIWNRLYAGKRAFYSQMRNGYLSGQIFRQRLLTHRVAWAIFHGEWPTNQIDHLNRIRSDNRISNLRVASSIQNAANRSSSVGKEDDEVGVFPAARGKFKAAISAGGKSRYLGTFASKQEARAAYLAALSEYIEVTQDKLGWRP